MNQIITSDIFLLALTIGIYLLGGAVFRKTRSILLHPVLITAVGVIAFLKLFDVDYGQYREATSLLDFALGMSVVALGYLLYEQSEQLRGRITAVLVTTVVGVVVGVFSVIGIAFMLGADSTVITSIAPKSVTVPIAIAISEPRGGVVAVTSVVVFCTGVLGSICGAKLLDISRVTDPMAVGFVLGAASHGIGTSRAVEIGALEGAMAGLAMALTGFVTALLLPLVL
ncbi:MAG: LrgB family protein [Alistipes sp.]|nr:LrgB family protein [Alistipes sp.]